MTKVQISLGDLAFQAEGGDPSAQYRLGILFLLGESVEQDLDAAYRWLMKAGKHQGADLLAEKIVQYQKAKIPEKRLGWLESMRMMRRLFALAARFVSDGFGHASPGLSQRSIYLTTSSWMSARNRVARVRFRAETSDFAATSTSGSQLRDTL